MGLGKWLRRKKDESDEKQERKGNIIGGLKGKKE